MSIATWRIKEQLLWSGYYPGRKYGTTAAASQEAVENTSATVVAQPYLMDRELILPILLIFTQRTEEHEQVV
jgi:hypothetical protein